jgi:hypothetical protein
MQRILIMDKETARLILRERQAGYDYLRRWEIDAEASRSVKDRLDDLNVLVAFTRELGIEPKDTSVSPTWRRWRRIRESYARSK